ncbi:MAG: respiratory nitrate reductase subunit gamma [Thiobacillus sp.]|nr:respiratory nitrate reductase subunit gamma [Gammaproteobacteria bacterium]MDP3126047.1 respiratory nitrate reductase subunit gamma [Thiobacillus sp.]
MSTVTIIYAGLFYIATLLLVAGLAYKIFDYSRTPAPLKIPTTPAPTTQTGVVYRMAKEVVLFESLFKSNKWIWVFGWLFHFGLLLVLMRHLRYFTEPVWFWVNIVQPFGKYASIMMVVGLVGLLARRFLVDRVRYISTPSDYLMLVLIILIGASGMLMTFVAHTDIVALKTFFMGLMYFDVQPVPQDPILLVHLALVVLLMLIFPISKLLHAPGVFFSPTRNQADNPREHRHVAAWATRLDQKN